MYIRRNISISIIFLKDKRNLYNMYTIKLHKTSKCLWPVYIDKLVVKLKVFLKVFINHFPKIHRSVLHVTLVCEKKISVVRVRQLAYVACVRMSTFIGVLMILDMRTLTRTLIFSPWLVKVFKIFLVLRISYYLLTAIYLTFICLSLEERYSLLFTFILRNLIF